MALNANVDNAIHRAKHDKELLKALWTAAHSKTNIIQELKNVWLAHDPKVKLTDDEMVDFYAHLRYGKMLFTTEDLLALHAHGKETPIYADEQAYTTLGLSSRAGGSTWKA
jgi:hypothetical protein